MWESGVAGLPRGLWAPASVLPASKRVWAAGREGRLRRAVHARVSPGTVNRPLRSWTREGEGPEDVVEPLDCPPDSLSAVV